MSQNTTSAMDTAVAAGDFFTWLQATQAGGSADVPCGTCNACCRAGYFIHIQADEQAAKRAIPKELRFKAPGQPEGHELMGFDQQGVCPMLKSDGCQIYTDRPQTCRDYDCRIFAATGIAAGGEEKQAVNSQVARWQFSYPNAEDRLHHNALGQAVAFLQRHESAFTSPPLPSNPTQRALLAIHIEPWFITEEVSVATTIAAIQKLLAG